VNPALVSRSRIFQLTPLTNPDLHRIARAALADAERGYGGLDVRIDDEALEHLVDVASGDARTLLNALELAVETTPSVFPPPPGEPIVVTRSIAEESIQRRAVLYDKEGDYHFDTISAFIKSLRGSDPDAALYWLARMVYAGEDPRFIFRRMLVLASEDVGMADPGALVFVEAAAATYERVGLPEGRYHLAHAALRLANAPKSNSAMGFFDALAVVEKEKPGEVPVHLKDANRDSEGFGHGEGYLYPHAYRDHWVAQQYLPDRLQGRLFYQPSDQGFERDIQTDVRRRREAQLEAMGDAEERPVEVLTFSRGRSGRDLWLERAAGGSSRELAALRDRLFAAVAVARHHLVLDLAAGEGLLTWEALRRAPEGGVWTLAVSPAAAAALSERASALGELERPHVLSGRIADLPALLAAPDAPRFDAAVGRNCLLREPDKAGCLAAVSSVLRPGGRLALAESVPARGQRLSELLDLSALAPVVVERLRQAEAEVYRAPGDPLTGWDEQSLAADAAAAGLVVTVADLDSATGPRFVRDEDLERWFAGAWGGALSRHLAPAELEEVRRIVRAQLAGREAAWRTATLLLAAGKPSS
jgi:putative ATPase